MNANVTSLTLAPICSILDGTEDVCADYTVCDVCWQGICITHSDQQTSDGRTDPITSEDGVVVHRACLEG